MIISMYHLVNSDLWKQKQNKRMNNKASITALMSSFGRVFHAENEEHPVFADHLARALMTDEEYAAVQSDILGGEPMKTAFSYGALEKLLEKHGFLIYELLRPCR